MPEQLIEIQRDERVYIVGKTKTGKTFLTRHLLRSVPRLVVIDPKNELTGWGLEEWNAETIKAFEEGEDIQLRVGPEPVEDIVRYWNDILWTIYEVGDCVVFIDEAYLLAEGNKYPQALMFIWTAGRTREIGAFSISQRPRFIPKYLISEAEHVFVFRLRIEDDRKYVASFTHAAMVNPIPREDPHGFYYIGLDSFEPSYISKLKTEHGDEWGEIAGLESEEELEPQELELEES